MEVHNEYWWLSVSSVVGKCSEIALQVIKRQLGVQEMSLG